MFINIVLLDNVYQRKIVSESAGIVDEFDCERTCMRRCLAVVESARSPRSKAVQCFKGVQCGRKQSKAVQRLDSTVQKRRWPPTVQWPMTAGRLPVAHKCECWSRCVLVMGSTVVFGYKNLWSPSLFIPPIHTGVKEYAAVSLLLTGYYEAGTRVKLHDLWTAATSDGLVSSTNRETFGSGWTNQVWEVVYDGLSACLSVWSRVYTEVWDDFEWLNQVIKSNVVWTAKRVAWWMERKAIN